MGNLRLLSNLLNSRKWKDIDNSCFCAFGMLHWVESESEWLPKYTGSDDTQATRILTEEK